MKELLVKDLSVRYGDYTVLDKVSFSLKAGQWLMVVGPNGAGKSTLLNAVSRGCRYTGEISLDGGSVSGYKAKTLAQKLGVLAQNHAVSYAFTVEEVVSLGRYAHRSGPFGGKTEEDTAAVERALEQTGLTALRNNSVLTLSGGELQRTFLAQLFAQDPEVLLLDEPTNHLDLIYQKQVFALVSEWLKTPGRAVLSVVHDLSLAKKYGTDALLLHKGNVLGSGPLGGVMTPEALEKAYGMDVYAYMRGMLQQWK